MSSECDDDAIEIDDLANADRWENVDLPDGASMSLPAVDRFDFRDHVEVIAAASGGKVSAVGPTVLERREFICCVDDVYFLRYEGDWGSSIEIVGSFEDRSAALAACIEASGAFVAGRNGDPVSAWTDTDDVHDIQETDVWDPNGENDDDVDPPTPQRRHAPRPGLSGCCRNPRTGRPIVFDTPERSTPVEQQRAWERLCETVVVHQEVVVAGEGASPVLPSAGVWHVIPCLEGSAADLNRAIGQCERATVSVDGTELPAVFTDRLAPTTAARIGAAFAAQEIWQLDHDSIRAISTYPAVITAETLRVR